MKETQHDFGLVDIHGAIATAEREQEAAIETSENEARPLYVGLNRSPILWDHRAPLTCTRTGGTDTQPTFTLQPGLPTDPKARKQVPLYSALYGYFPNALIAVAKTCFVGNEQHHPGTPLHWDRSKSKDHEDCAMRHLMDHRMGVPPEAQVMPDGSVEYIPHLYKFAWRALALLETQLDPREAPER